MKVSIDWLKEYVDIDLPVDKLADILTHIGFNLEEKITLGDDTVLDLEVTSNRPDCLCHIGIAREIAVALEKKLKLPDTKLSDSDEFPVEDIASVEVLSPGLCPRYIARIIKNVQVGPSPRWMVKRLESMGLRSVNNIVDITNYLLFEYSQPLHAFDLDKLSERKIIVREAQENEPFVAIDHTEHKLNRDNLVIADALKPVALAGVMGGLNTEVSASTKNILLESAQFDPLSIRRTARKLNLHSESSFRFERKVDPVNVDTASARAAGLICELAGGTLASGSIDLWQEKWKPAKITFRLRRIREIMGIDIAPSICEKIFKLLGLTIQSKNENEFVLLSPSHRADLSREIDLIEEVGRIVGFDKVPIVNRISISANPVSSAEKITRTAQQILNHCGFYEIITSSLVEYDQANLFTDIDRSEILRISDSRKLANDSLRSSLLPSLLATRKLNRDAGNARSDLYEIARVYHSSKGNTPATEHKSLSLLSSVGDMRAIKGAFELIEKNLNLPVKIKFQAQPMEWFLTDRSAKILLGERELGIAGVINQKLQKTFDLKDAIAVAEINLDTILSLKLDPPLVKPLPKFPAIKRDFSFILDEDISWQEIENLVIKLKIPDMEKVVFGEDFRGRQIPGGKKSLFFTVIFRNPGRSLTHEEVDLHQTAIIDTLAKLHHAELRMT